ncbi:MAG: hypothetical protein EAX89_15340 [Candidatus Lokiarchaeota archaeon]|nr:hypothetical protein [Candidatus Lokiarchaeota archaeon]
MSENLEKYQKIGTLLEFYLRPQTFPIAIKLIKDSSEIPPESQRPKRDLKVQTFLCQNFRMARSYGWTLAVLEEDCVCRVARIVYGWDEVSEEHISFAKKFVVGLYAQDAETSELWSRNLDYIDQGYIGLVISPLTRTKIEPDVVQIYCNPAQAMRIIQGYLYFKGGNLEFTASGRGGSCHEGVIKTIKKNEPQLIILGNGDRVWGGAEDYEVMFSIPKDKLEIVVEGLKKTHEAGLRYPIPKYMNYQPGFQPKFQKKAMDRAQGTIVKE